ncbi:replication initiation and membrane attachment family protein [Peribacillus deserti]|uniref:Replication initiation and membrane attachment protein n=1 Tax=Peribacillus deserti TaxID=673318 RepID=A0A2N5MA43_9BACI|nr:DnaD domain protein [Peribacillus deserti]PLT31195.1 Replication initiation and membrane attachment protein [Peribacillus deserti]
MQKHWQQILPIDRYEVCTNGLIHSYDRKVLALLYQPLIGPLCFSLYLTLLSEVEDNRLWSVSSSHHALMSTMAVNLREIFEARTKLEGIGLLKSWKRKEGEESSFIYELVPPLSPEAFFTDGMLNIYLYKKVGKIQYAKLKKTFSDHYIPHDQYQDVTKSFHEVFVSDHTESLYLPDDAAEDLSLEEEKQFITRSSAEDISGFEGYFDFDLLYSGLKDSFIPKKAFTPKVRDTIAKLSFLYGIDSLNMKNLLLDVIDSSDEIDVEELRKRARDWYQLEYNVQLPSLSSHIQPPQLHTQSAEARTPEEKHIKYLENVSPRQRLIDLSGGAEPSRSDLQIIEDILLNQQLTPGVANVLIEYVMMRSDMKLTKAYVEKIAGHWARKGIKTVKEAMELAKSEHRQYQSWANEKKTKKIGAKKAIRTEIVPDWLKEEEAAPVNSETTSNDINDIEERKRKLEEKLKKYQNRG